MMGVQSIIKKSLPWLLLVLLIATASCSSITDEAIHHQIVDIGRDEFYLVSETPVSVNGQSYQALQAVYDSHIAKFPIDHPAVEAISRQLQIREARMNALITFDEDINPQFTGLNDNTATIFSKNNEYIDSYVWVDGAEKVSGSIWFDDHSMIHTVFVSKGDKNDPTIHIINEYSITSPEKPYYIREDGYIKVYMDGFSGAGTVADPWHITNINELKSTGIAYRSNFFYTIGMVSVGTDGRLYECIQSYTALHPASLVRPVTGSNWQEYWNVVDSNPVYNTNRAYNHHYILKNDIDLNQQLTKPLMNLGIEPSGQQFFGTIDGDGYTISNTTINKTSNSVGFISDVSSGTIENLKLENIDVIGLDNVGGVVGRSPGAKLYNVSFSGNVTGNNNVGGLIGMLFSNGLIQNSYAQGSVSGNNLAVGGITGTLTSSTLENSYSTATINYIPGGPHPTSYGGLVGRTTGSGHIFTNNFWDTQSSGKSTGLGNTNVAGITGKTTAQMKTYETFSSVWDIVKIENYNEDTPNIWYIGKHPAYVSGHPDGDYPRLWYEYTEPEDNPPVAEFEADITYGVTPLQVTFTDLSTNDPDTWKWSYNSGGGWVQFSTVQSPTTTFTHTGIYDIRLYVENEHGNDTLIKTDYIEVVEPPEYPVAQFTSDTTTGYRPLTVQFTDLSSGSPTDWYWEFGDGGNSTLKNPQYTYQSTGTFSVSLTVTNIYGNDSHTKNDYISVFYAPPIANFEANRTQGDPPLNISFTDLSVPGEGTINFWHWDFGDGTTSGEQHPIHTYTESGVYTVTLTVVDDLVQEDTKTRTGYIFVGVTVEAKQYGPISLFIALSAIMGITAFGSFVMRRHDYYADILSGSLSSVIGMYLSIGLLVGLYGQNGRRVGEEYFNEATNTTITQFVTYNEPFINAPLSYIYGGFSVVMAIYTLFLLFKVIIDIMDDLKG